MANKEMEMENKERMTLNDSSIVLNIAPQLQNEELYHKCS